MNLLRVGVMNFLLDHFCSDHVGGAGLVQWQAGGDGDQVASFNDAGFERFLLEHSDHLVSVLKAARRLGINAPNQAEHFYRLWIGTDGDNRLARPITRDQPRGAA